MDNNKRKIFKAAAAGFLGSTALYAGGAKAAGLGNQMIVGPGGDFSDIQEALTAITDNGPLNPYQVFLLPGIFGGFDGKEFVDIIGSGPKSSIIETGFLRNQYIRLASNSSLANLGVKYSGATGGGTIRGAVEKLPGVVTEVLLNNLEFEIYNIDGAIQPGYAVNFGGKVNVTAYNLKIKTDGGGLRLSYGNSRWHGCDIYLTGKNVGTPHYGIVLEKGNRFDWYGGRIGTGYYYDAELDDPDQDVIGLYIPASNDVANCRAEVHDAEIFARNVSPLAGTKVNAVRVENGWARLYGCYCQAEINPDVHGNRSKSLYAAFRTVHQPLSGSGGVIETYGCRVRSLEGYVIGGAGVQGHFIYDSSMHNTIVQRYENLCLCDAEAGFFALKLENDSPITCGVEHVFKKTDTSNNMVVIDGNGATIDGKKSIELVQPYETIRLRRSELEWHIV